MVCLACISLDYTGVARMHETQVCLGTEHIQKGIEEIYPLPSGDITVMITVDYLSNIFLP